MALSLTILPSLIGVKNSMVMFTMDTSLFNFIGKISFCTYLVHLIVMTQYIESRTYDVYYSLVSETILFFSFTVLSLFFGFIMTIIIEIPCSKIQKALVSKILQKSESKQIKEQ
eukprot:GHVR01049793.1.p1 GENE.GHVR01049793.1~~GHVR01049793.1.p1  ORF type:complete len:114 (-),score=1.00 GHVR01049793.1:1495-1836(-)